MTDDLRTILDEYDDMNAPADLDLAAELEAHEADSAHKPFLLDTSERLDWAARKWAKADAEIRRLEDWRDAEIEKLHAAFQRRISQQVRERDYFRSAIEFGVESLTPDAKGRRSIKTPHLTASVTHRQEWRWPEDDALVAWAKAHMLPLVRVKESPDKAAFKAHVKASGEMPDGLEVVEVESVRLEVLPL